MKRLLLRASKSPFQSFTNRAIPKKQLWPVYAHLNKPGTRNIGNLVFAQSVFKSLDTPETIIDIDNYELSLKDSFAKKVDYINANYDAFVIPLCNSFRPDYKKTLKRMNNTLRRIKIPCIVPGVGAQLSLNANYAELDSIRTEVKEFVACILDRSASIGVRGEITKDYLINLGFPSNLIDIIGCPSMYYNGDRMDVRKGDNAEKIALSMNTVSIKDPRILQFTSYFNKYPSDVTYIPQDCYMMREIAQNMPPELNSEITISNKMPKILQPQNIAHYCDLVPWINFMKTQSFAIGTRIHGNIVALLAGTPAHVIAHDSRTLELARYFNIPYTLINNLKHFDLHTTFSGSSYAKLVDEHHARLRVYATFLERNGLEHNLYNKTQLDKYDARVQESLDVDRFPRHETFHLRLAWLAKKFTSSFR